MCIEEKEIISGAKQAENDSAYLRELLDTMGPEKQKMDEREIASKIIIEISESNPILLYPKWSIFIDYLKVKNAFTRLVAHIVISNLIKIDSENLIDQDLDKYLRIFHDESVMVCMHSIKNCVKVINYRPDLEQIITTELLDLEGIHYQHKHKELIKGSAIEAFIEYYQKSNLQKEILGFVKKQANSTSGKTKKMAKKFLDLYS